jgi:HEPN domain-containing protein
MSQRVDLEVRNWLTLADRDYGTAETMSNYLSIMSPNPKSPGIYEASSRLMEIVCYHCQQSAEKYLKAYLIYKTLEKTGEYPKHNHNLMERYKECVKIDRDFTELKKACSTINSSDLQRYPEENRISEGRMYEILKCAKKIRRFTLFDKLKNKVGYTKATLVYSANKAAERAFEIHGNLAIDHIANYGIIMGFENKIVYEEKE